MDHLLLEFWFLLLYLFAKKSLKLPLSSLSFLNIFSSKVFQLVLSFSLFGINLWEFGLFVRTLLFWEFVVSFFLLCVICLNEINLWACVFLSHPLCSMVLLRSCVELCWNKSFVDLFCRYSLDNKWVLCKFLSLWWENLGTSLT
jgi:hypothetical protein